MISREDSAETLPPATPASLVKGIIPQAPFEGLRPLQIAVIDVMNFYLDIAPPAETMWFNAVGRYSYQEFIDDCKRAKIFYHNPELGYDVDLSKLKDFRKSNPKSPY